MASIKIQPNGKYRALICKKNAPRVSRVFDTEIEAKTWASMTEIAIKSCPDIHLLNSKYLTAIDIIKNSIDFTPVIGVYFLIHENIITYIGKSTHIRRRVIQHQNDGRVFNAYSFILCGVDELDIIEKLYIRLFDPKENIEHRLTVSRKSLK